MGGIGGGAAQAVVEDRHQVSLQPLHHRDESLLKCLTLISTDFKEKLQNTLGYSFEKIQWLAMTVKRNHLV